MDKRRSTRSEKRRDRLSVRGDLPSSRTISSTTTSSAASGTATADVTGKVARPRRIESLGGHSVYQSKVGELERMESQLRASTSETQADVEVENEGFDESDDEDDDEPRYRFPGAYRVSQAGENGAIPEEDSTVGDVSTVVAQEIHVPNASLVEDTAVVDQKIAAIKAEAMVEGQPLPGVYPEDNILLNKRMVRCLVVGTCIVLVALAGALFLALLERPGDTVAAAEQENVGPSGPSEPVTNLPPTFAPIGSGGTSPGEPTEPGDIDGEESEDGETGGDRPTASPTQSSAGTGGGSVPTQPNAPSPTPAPTKSPTDASTSAPVMAPITSPTNRPTENPTLAPIASSTAAPVASPTPAPTPSPVAVTIPPTLSPIPLPTDSPTSSATDAPTASPTSFPTPAPTDSRPGNANGNANGNGNGNGNRNRWVRTRN